MNPEIKAQWLEALRSGEYIQGSLRLKWKDHGGPTQYCCLGVLCDLAEKAGVVREDSHRSMFQGTKVTYISTQDLYDRSSSVLPLAVMKWAGLNSPVGQYETDEDLVTVNDNGGSFQYIAGIIEEKF